MKDVIEIDVALVTDVRTSWTLLTEPKHLASWFGSHVSLDASLGGQFVENWEHEGRVIVTSGVVDELVPHERIAWTWKDDDWPVGTRLRFTLAAYNGGTRLTLNHSGWNAVNTEMSRDVRLEHESGWRKYMERLADYARAYRSECP